VDNKHTGEALNKNQAKTAQKRQFNDQQLKKYEKYSKQQDK